MNRKNGIERRSRIVVARRTSVLATAALVAGFLVARPVGARADDPPPGGGEDDAQAKIEAKMREILRLMRENGKSLLDASKGAAEKPKGVDVVPPDPSTSKPPPGTLPPPDSGMDGGAGMEGSGMDGGATPGGGTQGGGDPRGEIRRRMDEIIEQSGKTGVAIPKELEELIRMIPKKSSSSPSDGSGGEPKPRESGPKPKPQDGDPKKSENEPKTDPKRDPKDGGNKPPPEGDKGAPAEDDTPPWALELPAESRQHALNADPEKVPPKYRDLMIRYQKWLLERAAKARDGR